jgi:hypothetical protein
VAWLTQAVLEKPVTAKQVMHKKRKVDRVKKRSGLGAAVQATASTDGSSGAQEAFNLSEGASAPVATTSDEPSPCEESVSDDAEKSSQLERSADGFI